MPKNTPSFSKKLISWYLHNKRELPWRGTKNPYHIWLSEIMLQQTRVAQGLPYYLKFIENYPTVQQLAHAPEDAVLKLWQGLGYYSRARNLHATAKMVSKDLKGVFPKTYKDLLQLKGVGDYTASAIASICYNLPEAVVDGNVYRVLSRYFGISTPINSSAGQKEFKKLAQLVIDTNEPGTYNQAIMEFGARFCVPQNPNCGNCIFNDSCEAYKSNKVSELPVKLKSKAVRKRFFNYMVIISEDEKTLLQQRLGKGIWHKLYEFPLIETSEEVTLSELKKLPQFQKFSENMEIESISLYNETPIVHKLSHQHLLTRFWIVTSKKEVKNLIPISEIFKYAVPVLIENFVSEFFEGS
ncbi:A/G-specific adenine glycosylase [Aequorivita echinoideorum]|uniref:Adenine DNA glycosylase n=1 Tax=Aequorivita echinoideorum TaxID=1549647 RepID=A0ABS5S142_9FLAO|nr:A/G-specific adenine glycosylase [Aequorivita echinoideorum]MBT0606932.1 A/G-specific adenine glycosylase [Aequorivita echinoideorum]